MTAMTQDLITPPDPDAARPGVQLSAIIPVTERYDDPETVFRAYKAGIEAVGRSYEFIYVLDGAYPQIFETLQRLRDEGEPIKIIKFAKWFGESTALNAGFAAATGDIVLTLPAYLQVAADQIPALVAALDGADVVVARRWPRTDSRINIVQSKVFHSLLTFLLDSPLHDLGCSVRALKRRAIEELTIYGDQHRFLPLIAQRQGFAVTELNVRQDKLDISKRIYPFGTYIRRILDILVIFFLIKFTKKPLRFFGMIGLATLALGALMTVYAVGQRLFFDVALSGRPILVLSTLMIVLGIQIIAVGLIGEIVIFTHAKDMKEYHVDEIVE